MNKLIAPLLIAAFCGISGFQTYKLINVSKIATKTAYQLDSMITEQKKLFTPDPSWNYTWFDLGQDYHQIVDGHFYVTSVKAKHNENGYTVSGIVGNLDAMNKTLIKVQCGIKDSINKKDTIISGYIEVNALPSGAKKSFTVFVPMNTKNVSQIGVTIPEYRQ